ncbi:MAG: CCA tRNA nucleotidyltransferase [Nitrospina sp.]|jgi:poly(A) polymerase|nr:CCA tRNA nucleotidyltransferase [Nitrospina sp.]MBT5633381.1 CCA tRNA nucleotidyltransferase [Nitrospina sp.]
MDSSTKSILLELLNFSHSLNQKLYVVGGTLRDYLSRKPGTDFDLTGKHAAELGSNFARSLNFTCVPLDNSPGRQTVRVILNQNQHLDFTDLQGKNIEEDLSQRDFTINAMGLLLSDFLSGRKNIIDPHKGQDDLKNRKIRVLSGPIFQSDPLRMLRAFRFAATLEFKIDEETLVKISHHKSILMESAQERIWHELKLFLKTQHTISLLQTFQSSGILECLFPASDKNFSKTYPQYQKLESLLNEPEKTFPEYANELSAECITENQYLLKIAVLLKGIKQKENKEAWEIPYSDSSVVKEWNIRPNNAEVKFINQTLSGAWYLSEMYSKRNHGLDELFELSKKMGEELPASVIFFNSGSGLKDVALFCNDILKFYYHQFLPMMSNIALLDGKDIIHQFGLSPSPLFGKILHYVQKAQVLGNITTHEEAIALAEDIIQSQLTESE